MHIYLKQTARMVGSHIILNEKKADDKSYLAECSDKFGVMTFIYHAKNKQEVLSEFKDIVTPTDGEIDIKISLYGNSRPPDIKSSSLINPLCLTA